MSSWHRLIVVICGCFALSWLGCAVTPADRAFVQGARTFLDAHAPRLRDQISHDPVLQPIEKARLNHEIDDYEMLLLANEQRTGIALVGSR